MSSTSAIKIETLHETANIITQGIADTKAELANQAQLRETKCYVGGHQTVIEVRAKLRKQKRIISKKGGPFKDGDEFFSDL